MDNLTTCYMQNRTIKTIAITLLSINQLSAQLACPEPTYQDYSLNALSTLNKTQIPHHTLYDSVYPFADLEGYTGAINADTSNGYQFMQAYSELYYARNSTIGFQHPTDLYRTVKNNPLDPNIYHQIAIIDYQFAIIKPDAVSLNLLSVNNGKLYDVPNSTSSPYLSKYAKVAAVVNANNEQCLREGTHYFHFGTDYVIKNTGFNLTDIVNLEIYFGNQTVFNGPVVGLVDQNIPFSVSNQNLNFTVKMVLTTNTGSQTYYFSLCSEIRESTTSCSGQDVFNVTGAPYNGGYSEGTYSAFGRGTIYYADANCATKRITKPIIFVDGFDPFNSFNGNYIYQEYLNAEFKDNNNNSFRLGAELRGLGYDVIIFDQIPDPNKDYNTGGGGYIEHNGMALAAFLSQFYTTHASTIIEDYVVVGASMGGLITRYALTYAEHNNIPPHTRLFVAFDSPQNGAQIPIGIQNGLDKFFNDGLLKYKGKYNNALHQSNAAKQLLLHHSDSKSETPVAHPARASFYQHLTAIGDWPKQCRMISIPCGNGSGKKKNVLPIPNVDNIPPILSCVKNLDVGIKYRPLVTLPCFLDQCYKMRLETYVSTDNARCLSLDYSLNNAPLINLFGPQPLPYLSLKTYTQFNPQGNLDRAPGARFGNNPLSAMSIAYKSIAYVVSGPFVENKNHLYFGNFIPSTSAAAYTFPNGEPINYNKDFTGINVSKCAGNTPFDTVYFQPEDLAHVEINQSIANTFRSEIYFPKPKSVCSGACPEYITIGSTQNPNTSSALRASKAILIEPNYSIPKGTVFTAQIGCGSQSNNFISINKPSNIGTSFTLNACLFEFNTAGTQINCPSPNVTNFKIFTNNLGGSPYAEFSIDGVNWYQANTGEKGHEWLLLSNSGQPQIFYARPKNDNLNVITQTLNYCNN